MTGMTNDELTMVFGYSSFSLVMLVEIYYHDHNFVNFDLRVGEMDARYQIPDAGYRIEAEIPPWRDWMCGRGISHC